MASSRPDKALAAAKRRKYVSTGEASALLDGVVSPSRIRTLALSGGIKGALLAGGRQVLIPRASVPGLVVPLDHALTSELGGMVRSIRANVAS